MSKKSKSKKLEAIDPVQPSSEIECDAPIAPSVAFDFGFEDVGKPKIASSEPDPEVPAKFRKFQKFMKGI